MLEGKLPIKPHAVAMTKNILFVEGLKNGWKFYGKTGMSNLLNADGVKDPNLYHCGFIGWASKGYRRIIFSNHIEDDQKEEIAPPIRAKLNAKEKLTKINDKNIV